MAAGTNALLLGLGVAGLMIGLGALADSQGPPPGPLHPPPSEVLLKKYLPAIAEWKKSVGLPISVGLTSRFPPGAEEGSIHVQALDSELKFWQLKNGKAVAVPSMGVFFREWMKTRPEFT